MAQRLYLEDIAVGAVCRSREYEVREEDIICFAREFDPQPFHIDKAAAEKSFFAGLAASGWHTASITMRLLTETIPLEGGLIGAGGELQWKKPVRPGDRLYIEAEAKSITPHRRDPSKGFIDVIVNTLNQNSEIVQQMRCSVLGQYRG